MLVRRNKATNVKHTYFVIFVIIVLLIVNSNSALGGWFSKDIKDNHSKLLGTWKINLAATKALKQNANHFRDESMSFLLSNVLPNLTYIYSKTEVTTIDGGSVSKDKYNVVSDYDDNLTIEFLDGKRNHFLFISKNEFISRTNIYIVFERK